MGLSDLKLTGAPHSPLLRLAVIVVSVLASSGGTMLWTAWTARGVYDELQEQKREDATGRAAIERRLGVVEDAARRTDRNVGDISDVMHFIAGKLGVSIPSRRGDLMPDEFRRGHVVPAALQPPG